MSEISSSLAYSVVIIIISIGLLLWILFSLFRSKSKTNKDHRIIIILLVVLTAIVSKNAFACILALTIIGLMLNKSFFNLIDSYLRRK